MASFVFHVSKTVSVVQKFEEDLVVKSRQNGQGHAVDSSL